ncbi:MAG: phage protease [Desulfobacterales bacterium]|nr:phage protease [Desulfobacterales bacterium]
MEKKSLKIALNVRLPGDGSLPDWVELIPAGELVQGRDGRKWTNPAPDQVVAATMAYQGGADLPIDWEHATEKKAPKGEKAPAAGWIKVKTMEVRDGAIWGETGWTDDGTRDVQKKAYRYLSPVLVYRVKDRRIIRLDSAGLTNKPNLHLTALNQAQTQTEETGMDFFKAICKALGLADGTTEEQALAKVTALKGELATAENRALTPDLQKFVPRTDYDAVVERAENAEQKLEENETQALKEEIDTAINQALKDGKITPGSKEYHKAQCKTDGGLDRFKEFVKTAPKLAQDSDLKDKDLNQDKGALTDEDKAVCQQLGIPEDDYLKTKKGEA